MTATKAVSINLALYIFVSLNPYFRWIVPNGVLYIFFIFSTYILNWSLRERCPICFNFDRDRKIIFIFYVIYILYFTTGLVHEMRWGHFLWPIPFLMAVFYNDRIFYQCYKIIRGIFVLISLFSIFFWLINLFSVPFPYIAFNPDFRHNPNDWYKIYGPVISLYRGGQSIGEFYGIERVCGVFAEPGHFGLYLGFILAIERFCYRSRQCLIMMMAGLLTFSTAFYAIFFIGILCNVKIKKMLVTRVISMLFFLSLFLLPLMIYKGDAFYSLTLGRVFEKVENFDARNKTALAIIDSRVSTNFIDDYNKFSETTEVYFGRGYFDHDIDYTTNWRSLVFRFGVIGLSIIILLFLAISSRVGKIDMILLLSLAVLVLSHRSYLLYGPAFYLLAYLATAVYRYESIP